MTSESCAVTVVAGDTGQRLRVIGALTFETAATAHEAGRARLASVPAGAVVEIDCAEISKADSSGLAVLLDWLRTARSAGYTLRFAKLPNTLLQLASISEVQALLQPGP